MRSILLVQGANMVYLGKREPEFYGSMSAQELDEMVREHAHTNGYGLDIFYTNIEGEAINRVYQAADSGVDGLVMNPAGFSHAGYALRDCIKGTNLPYVEVHMSNIEKRNIHSVLTSVAEGAIFGFGAYSYVLGLEALLHILDNKAEH